MLNKNLLAIFVTVFFSTVAFAQGTLHTCGTEFTPEMMQRLMRNRAHEAEYKTLLQSRSTDTVWVPTVFHSVGLFDGSGKIDDKKIYENLCKLNIDYAPLKIQFYLAAPIMYHDNPVVYTHVDRTMASSAIIGYITDDIRNALNIFIGGSANSSTGGGTVIAFYNPSGDYVFSIASAVGGNQETLTHEVGHYFSLPHPFNGWDGTTPADRTAFYNVNGGNAPLTGPGGALTEYVSRNKYTYDSTAVVNTSGGPLSVVYNRRGGYPEAPLPSVTRIIPAGATYYTYHDSVQYCRQSGDYFCSTGADYNVWLPYQTNSGNCPNLPTLVSDKDPDGVLIRNQTPYDTYMNYSGDACTDKFEADQIYAIKFDALARNYETKRPESDLEVTGTTTILSPADGEEVPNAGMVTITFAPVPNATHYNVQVWRTTASCSSTPDAMPVAYGTTDNPNGGFIAYGLQPGLKYKIRVKAYNDRSFCTSYKESCFTAGNWATGVNALNTLQDANLQPNPSEAGSSVRLEVAAADNAEGTLIITNMNGQTVKATNNVVISQGLNILEVDTNGLTAGMYIVTLKTATGAVNMKMGLN